MKLFKSKSEKESVKNLIRDFFNSEECDLNHGTDKIESDIESLKVRVHRLECSTNSNNAKDNLNNLNYYYCAFQLPDGRKGGVGYKTHGEYFNITRVAKELSRRHNKLVVIIFWAKIDKKQYEEYDKFARDEQHGGIIK